VQIAFTNEELGRVVILAWRTARKFKGFKGHYTNSLGNHFVGHVGSLGAEKWALANGLAPVGIFRDIERAAECDLHVTLRGQLKRVEVKTWSQDYWDEWGRCVAVGQVDDLKQKTDLIVWAVVFPDDDGRPVAMVNGWSTLADVVAAPKKWTGPAGRQVHNHQVDAEKIRDLASLLAWDGRV